MQFPPPSNSETIHRRISQASKQVWTPSDFVDIGGRDAVDKALQRMAKVGKLRRIDRGLYDTPSINRLTGNLSVPDYRAVIDAVARRNKTRFLIDGMTAANIVGMTNVVPAKVEVLVAARLKPVRFGNLQIVFKPTAPGRLYWAGRPGMHLVQALHWMKDVLSNDHERSRVLRIVRKMLRDKDAGPDLLTDLRDGLSAMPIWMQNLLRPELAGAESPMTR